MSDGDERPCASDFLPASIPRVLDDCPAEAILVREPLLNLSMSNNVDHDEVEKFAVLAARWWDKDSEFKPLHDINPLRLNYIKEQCGGSLKGKRILDIGCGGGILSESLALEGATVVGIDLAEAGLEVAKLHLLESGFDIDYQFISAEDLTDSESESFDIITCLEMLEHVPDPSMIIEACSLLLTGILNPISLQLLELNIF